MWEERFAELSVAAGRQRGLITSAQANRLSVDDSLLDHFKQAGLLWDLDWTVYQLPGSPLGPRYAYPAAAWLALSPETFRWERPDAPAEDAVLSHESACGVLGIGSISAPLVTFTAPAERETPRAVRIHVARLAPDEVTIREGIPVTTPHRTIIDLVRDWTEHGDLRGVISDAVRRDVVDLWALHESMAPLAAEHEFPVGAEFLEYFLGGVSLDSLPARNLRAYAGLAAGDKVAEVQRAAHQAIIAARELLGSPGKGLLGDSDEALSRDIAAEIIGRIVAHG